MIGQKITVYVLVAAIFSMLLWIATPSSLFIQPISTKVEGTKVTFVRQLPYGAISARWWSDITLVGDAGLECTSGAPRRAYYQETNGNTVTFHLGAWASDCVDAAAPYYLTTWRQVMVFGLIPLRASRDSTEILLPAT